MGRCVLSGLLRQWYPWIIPIATSRQWTVSLECMVVGPYSGRTSTLNFPNLVVLIMLCPIFSIGLIVSFLHLIQSNSQFLPWIITMRVALRTGHVHNDNVSTCNLLTCIKNKHLTFSWMKISNHCRFWRFDF